VCIGVPEYAAFSLLDHVISAAIVLAGAARSQSYLMRPVRPLIGFVAGAIVDVFARLVGQWLSDRLGHH
jgi:tripartite-type tricarboxylate transporter receptor subunit TctC